MVHLLRCGVCLGSCLRAVGRQGVVVSEGSRTLAGSQAVTAASGGPQAPRPRPPPPDHRGMVLLWTIGEVDG